jgi:hypothetical protein
MDKHQIGKLNWWKFEFLVEILEGKTVPKIFLH